MTDSWLGFGIPLRYRSKAGVHATPFLRLRNIRREIVSFWGGHGRPHWGGGVCPCPRRRDLGGKKWNRAIKGIFMSLVQNVGVRQTIMQD